MTQEDASLPADPAHVRLGQRRRLARILLALNRQILSEMGSEMATPGHWSILLELYVSPADMIPAYQSRFATDEPPSNAHRRAVRLAQLGAIERHLDLADRRRTILALGASTRTKLDRILDWASDALTNARAADVG